MEHLSVSNRGIRKTRLACKMLYFSHSGMWVFGNLIYFAAVCCANIVMLLACLKWSWPLIIAVCIGPLAWLVICGLYQLILMESNYAFYGSISLTLQDPMLYLALPILLFVTPPLKVFLFMFWCVVQKKFFILTAFFKCFDQPMWKR